MLVVVVPIPLPLVTHHRTLMVVGGWWWWLLSNIPICVVVIVVSIPPPLPLVAHHCIPIGLLSHHVPMVVIPMVVVVVMVVIPIIIITHHSHLCPHPSCPHPVSAVMVGVFAAYLSLVIVLSWSRRPLSIAPLSAPECGLWPWWVVLCHLGVVQAWSRSLLSSSLSVI